jgi:hypothetical protein
MVRQTFSIYVFLSEIFAAFFLEYIDNNRLFLEFNQTINHDCCQNLSQKNYCFLYHSKQHPYQVSVFSTIITNLIILSIQNGACMEARSVTQHPPCILTSDCQHQSGDSSCVHPFTADNITRLIRISHSQGPAILFVGSINEIYRTSKKKILFLNSNVTYPELWRFDRMSEFRDMLHHSF